MKLTTASYWLPKQGNGTEENEDAYYPTRDGEKLGPLLKFAVADGATVTFLSKHWARLLVKTFSTRSWNTPEQFLNSNFRLWDRWIKNYLRKREQRNQPIAWFEEPGLSEGAFSTLLGVTLRDGDTAFSGSFTAFAVGDSCLFQIRDDTLINCFPHDSSRGFISRPYLISSRPEKNIRLKENLACCRGDWRSQDELLLMTDALACWFIKQHEAGKKPWELLRPLTGSEGRSAFYRWIMEQREQKAIRNDDVTLLGIYIM